jgi:hypothetical protein
MARNATQKFNIQSVGEVELSRILRKHFKTIIKSVSLEPREFTVFVINNLLIKPKLNITEIQSLPDATLEQIALQILGKEEYLKKYFSEAKGESVFDRFLQAFKDQQREQVNLYLKMIAPFLGQTQNTEAMFSLGYTLPSSVRYIKKTKQVEFIEESSGQLSVLLNEIDPDLELKRRGAWQTFRGESNDRISQAAHSMREVIRLLLDCLAPEEKILHAPWYQKPRVKPDVTRKMKVRFAIGGASSEISDSTVDFVDSLANAADEAYYKLSAEAHTSGKGYKQAEAFLKAGEAVILLILTNRFQNSA